MWPFPDSPDYATAPAPSPTAATPAVAPAGAMCWVPPWSPPPYEAAPTAPPVVESSPLSRLLVEVEIGSPDISANETVSKGSQVVIAVPQGARTYRVAFAPTESAQPFTAFPVALVEPAAGRVDGGQLTLTPIWLRHGKAAVESGDVGTSLVVFFR
jgi:hypothetical protein